MKSPWMKIAALSAVPWLGACAQDAGPTTPPNAVSVNVAPLTLPGVGGASYTLTVTNGAGQTVWTKANVTASQYGDGKGSIAYVGPCDADTTPAGNENNTVSLVLNDLFASDGTTALTDFTNPCPAPTGCELSFECKENADVPVTFNLTIMRSANQGFFDIAVNFDNIFCSAKFDTCYPDANGVLNDPIELLFAADGERHHTGVLGLACTAGPNAADATHLYMTDIEIRCDDGQGGTTTFTLDPTAGPGNVYSPAGAVSAANAGTATWQYAVYEGQEQLNCTDAGGQTTSCDKMYWNVAIGLEGLPANCSIAAKATASEGALPGGLILGANSYPIISFGTQGDFDVIPVTDQDGAVICQANPLNGTGSGVVTDYKPVGPTIHMPNESTQDGSGNVDSHESPFFLKYAKAPVSTTATAPGGGVLQLASTGGTPYIHCTNSGVSFEVFGPITDPNNIPTPAIASGTCAGAGMAAPANGWYQVVLSGSGSTTISVDQNP